MPPIVPPASSQRERLLQELGIARAKATTRGGPQPSLLDSSWLGPAESDERFRRVLRDLRAAMTEFDQEGRLIYVSPSAVDIAGYEPHELIGSLATEHVHDDDLPLLLELSQQLSEAGRTRRTRFRSRHRDGHWIWLELVSSTRFVAPDGSVHSVTFTRDVTEQKTAEDALRESETRYRAIVEGSQDLVVELDETGRAAYHSVNVESVLGFSLEELAGVERYSRIHPDDRERVATAVAEGFRSQRAVELSPLRVQRGDGRWIQLESRGFPYQCATGERRLLMVARDVTERVRREAEQRQLEQRMQQAQRLESLGVLAGGIAHDFNNLLTPILGDASLLLEDLPPGSPLRARLQRIQRASLRAAQLTAQMLSYAGAEPLSPEAVELSDLVRELGGLLHGGVAGRVELHYELARGLPRLEADPSQLTQVVMNLITNAAEATPGEHGRVELRTGLVELPGRAPGGELVGEAPAPGRYVYLEVEDRGCGMDAETRARIFDPFFSTKFQGRGLGLAAVIGIVRAHLGCIEIESAPGEGTRFRVLLPCGKAHAPA